MVMQVSAIAEVDLPDETATLALAGKLARAARVGDVVALWGRLGVGKTVFARGFIRARCGPVEEVPSPTFTIVQVYDPVEPYRGPVYHFDLYRLSAPEDAYEAGIEEAFTEGISLIEWPDRLGDRLPAERLDVRLRMGATPDRRHARLEGRDDWPGRIQDLGLA